MPRRDRPLALLCLLSFTLCTALFLAMQAHYVRWWRLWEYLPLPDILISELMLAVGASATVWLSCANARGQVTARSVFIGVTGLVIATLGSHHFFGTVMHDLSIDIGQHPNRWCPRFDENGDPYYFVRTETAPLLLFGPIIVLLALRGWWVVRRNKAQRLGRASEATPTA